MPRNWSKAAPKDNDPVPQREKLGLTNPRWQAYIDFLKKGSIDK